MTSEVRWFEDVEVGLRLPEIRRRPSTVQLFRFSAITWNAHRIHFERAYAQREGYPDVLVHSQLHGCFLAEVITDWMGPRGRLLSFAWQNRAAATSGTELVARAVVRRVYARGDLGYVELELEERDEHDVLCAPGSATVALPRRMTSGGAQTPPTRQKGDVE